MSGSACLPWACPFAALFEADCFFDFADVINNAGVYGKRLKFGEFTAADMLHTFTTNCVGPLLVIQNLHR